MILSRLRIFPRSSTLRLGAGMTALFLAALLIAFAIAQEMIGSDLEDRVKTGIEEEARLFLDIFDAEGEAALIARLNAQVAGENTAHQLYLYTAADGSSAGNARLDESFIGWRALEGEDVRSPRLREDDAPFTALGIMVGDGTLIIAHGTELTAEMMEIITHALIAALAIAGLLATGGTLLLARRTEARIREIAETLDAVSLGDFDRRAPEGTAGQDDIGRIALAINRMLDQLSANISSLRQISADIAHDLKTPIQRLRSTLEGLEETGADTNAIASDAISQTDSIVRVFQALLRIAQIEGGSPRARFTRVDLTELVTAIADAFQPGLEDEGRDFSLDIPAGKSLMVEGDRDLLGQMLSNLLNNAIRHAPAPAAVSISLAHEGNHHRIIIADKGPGIPEGERENVFRRLYRLERSRTTEGSGLGLAMVAAVIRLHEGSIRLEDNNPGLRVVIMVPTAM